VGDGNHAVGAAGAKEFSTVLNLVLAAASAIAAAAASTSAAVSPAASDSPALVSHSPWWETLTVTIADNGQASGCEYRTSLMPQTSKACDVEGAPAAADGAWLSPAAASSDQYTRLTFERRFRPTGGALAEDQLPSGDTLLGSQVLALAIDASGAVAGCKIVAAKGELTPDYGCKEAVSEQFEASAGALRSGYLSVLVYAHSEEVV
jgi:hypothetical protein